MFELLEVFWKPFVAAVVWWIVPKLLDLAGERLGQLRQLVTRVTPFQLLTFGIALVALLNPMPISSLFPAGEKTSESVSTAPDAAERSGPRQDDSNEQSQGTISEGPIFMDQRTIVVHTEDAGYETVEWGYPPYVAPDVPDVARTHDIDLGCPDKFVPLLSWPRVIGSHPSIDALYSMDTAVHDKGVSISVRAREGRRGYAYVRVVLLCRQIGPSRGGSTESE